MNYPVECIYVSRIASRPILWLNIKFSVHHFNFELYTLEKKYCMYFPKIVCLTVTGFCRLFNLVSSFYTPKKNYSVGKMKNVHSILSFSNTFC